MDETEVESGPELINGFHIYEPANFDRGLPWKYCIAFQTDDVERMVHIKDWCLETFGESGDNMYYITNDQTRWYDVIPYGELYLRDDPEMFMFNLKWLAPEL